MDNNPHCRVPLASLLMVGVVLIVMSPPQSADARSNPWYVPYSRYTPTRSTTTCGDAIVQKPNSSGVQEVCDSGTNNGKAGYCDKTCSCMMKAWYGDNDGDGFGSPYTIASCTKPAGKFTDKPGDWNDSLATMYPGAPELCDGLDNNQNNAADEGIQIDDGNFCTDDFCMGGKVYHSNNKKSCNDNNACTNNDMCALGKCGGTPVATTATYSEWGVCQANSIQTRTVTFNPPGCGNTAGLLLAQKCAPPQPSPPQPPAPFWPGQKKLAVGSSHICAFSKNGKLQCWGSNKYGQLGNGKLGPDVNPYAQDVQFSSGDVPMSVSAGGYKTCSPLSTGAVKCWGDNATTPTAVAAVTNAKAVVVGYGHACALLTTGTVKCWGDNKFGQLGDGTLTASTSNAPVDVKNLSNVIDVAVGQNYTCALIKGGSVKCWGNNEFGQLGNNSQINSVIPVTVLLTKPASSIIAGGEHTCALMSDLTVQCWGWNGLYQQGPKKYSGNNLSPVTVEGLNIMSVSELALGYGYTCVLGYSGSWVNTNVLCVGDNKYGQVGAVGANVDKPTKVPVPNIVTSMAAGGSTVCAVILNQSLGTSSLQCWGEASHGELGSDPTQQSGLKSSQISYPGGSYTLYYAATPTVVSNASVGTPIPPPPLDCGVGLIWDTGSQLCACPSGKKWDTTGKQCVAYTGNAGGGIGGGGSPPTPAINKTVDYWTKNEQNIYSAFSQLVTTSQKVATEWDVWNKSVITTIEDPLTTLVKTGVAPPKTSKASKVNYQAAEDAQKAAFEKLNTLLVGVYKADTDPTTFDSDTEKIYAKAAFIHFSALTVLGINQPIPSTGKTNPGEWVYKYSSSTKNPYGYNPIKEFGEFITSLQGLPKSELYLIDQALFGAYSLTTQMVQKLRPKYGPAINDELLGMLAPLLINILDQTTKGPEIRSRYVLQQYADRMKTLKFNTKSPPETGVNIIPDILMLYNPTSKKAEEVKLCSILSSPDMVWNESWTCAYYPNLIKTIMDPKMTNGGVCPFWDTARIGKPCQPPITWLDGAKIKKVLESLFVSTAYADEIGSCVDCSAYEKTLLQTQEASTKPPFAQGYNSKGEASYVIDQACHDPTDYPDLCGKKLACPNGTKSMGGSGYEPGWQGACWANKICIAELKLQHCKTAANPFSDCGGTCGDSVVQAGEGEECDDGKDNGIYCCSKTCKRELPTCGNGILDGKADKKGDFCEKCDDGNKNNGDGCTHVCEKEPCLKWKCGNKIKEGPEDCDDGNNKDGDGCSNYCKNEKQSICGNTVTESPEDCDDGNTKNGDGCSNVCKKEKKEWCEQCQKKNLLECQGAAQLKKDALSGCCFLPNAVINDKGKTVCQSGEPCSCGVPQALVKCGNASSLCYAECKKVEGPNTNPPKVSVKSLGLGQELAASEDECKKWVIDHPPAWWNAYNEFTPGINALLSQAQNLSGYQDNVIAFKEDGTKGLEDIFGALVDMVEYHTGTKFTPNQKLYALDYGLSMLDQAQACNSDQVTIGMQACIDNGKPASVCTMSFGAFYSESKVLSPAGMICWNDNVFSKMLQEDAKMMGTHEAAHAVMYALREMDRRMPSDDQSPIKGKCSESEDALFQHWVMKLLNVYFDGSYINDHFNPANFAEDACKSQTT